MKKLTLIVFITLIGYSQSFGQCGSNLTITGLYGIGLTQSSDWIISSSTTSIAPSTNVTLEATDYIQLNPDFMADATSVFLAHIVPCAVGIKPNVLSDFLIWPNPTSNIFTVQSSSKINAFVIYDNNGRVLQSSEAVATNAFEANLNLYSEGIYFLEIHSELGKTMHKIVRK